ncbi:MAG: class I SAM-dependent methyltransferase [Patescibacteria group bacterium]
MANHIRYMDVGKQVFDAKFTESRNCPICGSSDADFLLYKSGGYYVKCPGCSLIFTNPVFKDDELKAYYESNHNLQSVVVEEDSVFYDTLYNSGLDIIEKHTVGLRVLDIGCSSGQFLKCASKRGHDVVGIELNETEAEQARAACFNVVNDVNELHGCFDAITMWDVLEHIKDGKTFIKSLLNRLNEGGVVFIQTPNVYSLASRIMQCKCNMFDGLEHVNLYGEKAIGALAELVGMEIKHLSTVIAEIPVINNYLNYEDPYTGSFTNDKLVLGINKDEILESKLGYKLQVLLKRK